MIRIIESLDNGIDLISMQNDELEIVVSNFGCTIVRILMNDKDGHVGDVVLGYVDFKSYQTLDAIWERW